MMARDNPVASVDEKLGKTELLVSYLLRLGVGLSFLLILCGTAVSFFHHPDYLRSRQALERLTEPGHALPHTWSSVASGLAGCRGESIVAAGLIVLIATPMFRVAVMALAFYFEGDRLFAFIGTIVLCLLLISIVLGKSE